MAIFDISLYHLDFDVLVDVLAAALGEVEVYQVVDVSGEGKIERLLIDKVPRSNDSDNLVFHPVLTVFVSPFVTTFNSDCEFCHFL